MAKNASVERFRRLTKDLQREVASEGLAGLAEQAEDIANTMRSVVHEKSGHTKESIRVEPGPKPFQILIKAGGPLTTKPVRKGAKATYDYALAEEWGTREMNAQPFFFPVMRLKKKRARSAVKRRITKAVKKRSAE